MNSKNARGFTLIEILVVIGIIAVLAAIVIVAINPARQFAQARNTQRTSDVTTISNALGQYRADNKGSLPNGLTTPLATSTIDSTTASGHVSICGSLYPNYMTTGFPQDPGITNSAPITDCSSYISGYSVAIDPLGRTWVYAPSTESLNGGGACTTGATPTCNYLVR